MIRNEISIPVGGLTLIGNLNIPPEAKSLIVFSHGSGSSRFSKRNNYVAEILNRENNAATLLTDLLSEEEDQVFENRFDIDLLTERLVAVTFYIQQLPYLKNLSIGYFGASTGAASALQASEKLRDTIRAIVSRGGRPDMAKNLNQVKAPTLLIVGSLDTEVIDLNEKAYAQLTCEKRIEIVKGASHLFEEPGKLDIVAHLSSDWFKRFMLNPKIKSYVV